MFLVDVRLDEIWALRHEEKKENGGGQEFES
jgi:hypothetical protein